jgi:hypothetical protein
LQLLRMLSACAAPTAIVPPASCRLESVATHRQYFSM